MTHRFPLIGFLSVAFVVSGTLAAERARPAGPRTEGRAAAAFRKVDRDGDGRLTFSEWHRTRRGAEAMPSKALELFRTSDLNRNLRLSPYEFGRSQGIRITVVTSNSTHGNGGEGSRGVTISMGSAGGSNGTLGLTGGSSITVNGGATGVTLQFGSSAGGSRGSVTDSISGTVAFTGSANTLTLGSGNLTIDTLNPLTLLTAPGTTDSSGNTILNAVTLSLSGGGTFHVGMLPVGTIQGGNLFISGTFSRYVGLTLEAAQQLAESEDRASRVFSIDGVPQAVTADRVPTRVNFFLVDGIVKLAIGG